MGKLTHMEDGRGKMVDISHKESTVRIAIARGSVKMDPSTVALIEDGKITKGNVYEIARTSAIMGAKRTWELIPLCHPIPIDQINVIFWVDGDRIFIESEAKTTWKTGIEMEALTAVSVAALTIYDMIKGADKRAVIEEIRLIYKEGGKSGVIQLDDPVISNPEKWEDLQIR